MFRATRTDQFDDENGSVSNQVNEHTVPSFKEDLDEVIKQKIKAGIFNFTPGRNRGSLIDGLDNGDMVMWLGHVNKLSRSIKNRKRTHHQ